MACWLPLLHVQPTFYDRFFHLYSPDDLGCVHDLTTLPCRIKTIKTLFLVFCMDLFSINGLLPTPICLKLISFRAIFILCFVTDSIISLCAWTLVVCRGLTTNFLYNETNIHKSRKSPTLPYDC